MSSSNRQRASLVVAGAFALLLSATVFAEPGNPTSFDKRKAFFEQALDDRVELISRWERHALIQLTLLVSIAVLGGATTALQTFDRKWCKVCTGIIGAAVGTLTVISANAFDADRRQLRQMAVKGQTLIENSRDTLARLSAEMAATDQNALFEDVRLKLTQIIELEGSLRGSLESTSTSLSFSLLPTVHAAQSRQPSWLTSSEFEDEVYRYVVGRATAASASVAKQASYDIAIGRAAKDVGMGNSPSRDYISYVTSIASVVDTFFSYDQGKSSYTYWTLLRLPRVLGSPNAAGELADIARRPSSFYFDYGFDPPGRRFWSKTVDGTWSERYGDGKQNDTFRPRGQIRLDDCAGTLASSTTRSRFDVFIPDRSCRQMWIRFKNSDGPWEFLGEMKDIK